MEYTLEVYSAFCATSRFEINGVEADSDDFGTQEDLDRDSAEPYGCGRMTFIPSEPTQSVLSKYGITAAQYEEIAEKLADELSFGRCGWCT